MPREGRGGGGARVEASIVQVKFVGRVDFGVVELCAKVFCARVEVVVHRGDEQEEGGV